MNIRGACHCGNIQYQLRLPLDGDQVAVRACSCSFCTKHRGTYTSHPDAELDASVMDASALTKYTFASGTAEFYVCSRCGVVPFVCSTIDAELFAVVNVNTFDLDPDSALTFDTVTTNFDGESTQSRLARRKRTWISNVSIKGA